MKIPSLVEMLEAGVHFGHQVSRWHPKMERFIYTERNGVHILNLELVQKELEGTLDVVRQMAAEGKQILFVTTKPQARDIVREAAVRAGMPFLVDRWLGGLLTNFAEMKKLISKYTSLKEEQRTGELERYTKKEQIEIGKKLVKMDGSLGGLTSLTRMPDALFIPAMQREKTAVTEANQMNVPIVGVCDTNANPEKATYIIPANDDAIQAIAMIVNLVADAVLEGRAVYEKAQKAAAAVKAAPAPAKAAEEVTIAAQ